jgi:hypothetical protein
MIVILALTVIIYFSIQVILDYRSNKSLLQYQAEKKKVDKLEHTYQDSVKFLNTLKKQVEKKESK